MKQGYRAAPVSDAKPDQRPVVLVSGGRTTMPLVRGLAGDYQIAALTQQAAQALLTEAEPVLCPLAGADARIQRAATNDAALIAGRVITGLPTIQDRFSTITELGVGAEMLDGRLNEWLPGLVASLSQEIAVTLRSLEAFCNVYDVACYLAHEDVTPAHRAVALYLKGRGIPTIHLPHANCYVSSRPDVHDESVCDWMLATSPWMRDWYVERGYDAGRIQVVGCPPWDGWRKVRESISREHARLVLGLEGSEPVVHFCTSWPQMTTLVADFDIWGRIGAAVLEATKQNGWQLVWTLHPGEAPGTEQRYAQQVKAAGVKALITRGHLHYVVRAADVVLAVGPSNVLVEAALAKRAIATVNLVGHGFPETPPWRADAEPKSLAQAVNKALNNRERWNRDAFVTRYAYSDDGEATTRALAAVREIIGGR